MNIDHEIKLTEAGIKQLKEQLDVAWNNKNKTLDEGISYHFNSPYDIMLHNLDKFAQEFRDLVKQLEYAEDKLKELRVARQRGIDNAGIIRV